MKESLSNSHQVTSDGLKVWINDPNGRCVGRFGPMGYELIGRSNESFGLPASEISWRRFREEARMVLNVYISEAHRPDQLSSGRLSDAEISGRQRSLLDLLKGLSPNLTFLHKTTSVRYVVTSITMGAGERLEESWLVNYRRADLEETQFTRPFQEFMDKFSSCN